MKIQDMVIILAVLLVGFYIIRNPSTQKTIMNPVQVIPIEHASGILVWENENIYVDPVGDTKLFEGKPAPSIILVTDIHGDHFSVPTLESIEDSNAVIIAPEAVKNLMPENLASITKVLSNGEALEERRFQITAMPMYNLPTAENANFHTSGRGNGYVLEKDSFRVYIAGDTAGTPEMRALRDIDIAFVPMNLPYTMDVKEAADTVLEFKPKIVYPYHYRGPDGLSDVNHFKELVNSGDSSIEVILANWYPNLNG